MAELQTDLSQAETASTPRPHPRLRARSIVLVGLMGAGKTTVGKGLASALRMPFRDADIEIERAARRTVAEIFAERGEAEFRDGERRVIARLLTQEPPHVLATGGGAFMQSETRAVVQANAISIWLKVDLDLLVRRVSRKKTRPLLHNRDPREVLTTLAEQRYPHYAEAALTVESGDASVSATVQTLLSALNAHLYALDRETAL
jgi:shikimate kinase